MKVDKTDKKETVPEVDPKLIANIVCKKAQQELKETIINQKDTEDLNDKYKLLLTTEKGYMQDSYTQEEILKSVDVSTKTKKMDIELKYGPYYVDFTRDGRYLCVGGLKGQLAMLDWKTKDLKFDINVKEKIRAIKYLHRETFIAVSQLDYTYIYDNEGKELHCIRQIFRADHLEFLPHHFLLVAGTEKGFLHYLDVSTGNIVSTIKSNFGSVNMMCQNKSNAMICTAHNSGTVSMWSPNEMTPAMRLMCHETPLRSVAIDNSGHYLVTAGQDRKVKIWDLRNTGEALADLRIGDSPSCMQFSDTGLLAVASGRNITVLENVHNGCQSANVTVNYEEGHSKRKLQPIRNVRPYLTHSYHDTVQHIQFCPYEDILGVGLTTGFSTMFVPGSGEANIDAFECNPYGEIKFRKEQEVKRLLEKIPAEFISHNTNISSVHKVSIKDEWDSAKDKLFGNTTAVEVKKKRSNKTRAKPATTKKVATKDNIHYERLKLQGDMFRAENVTYKVKRPLAKEPINSVLDNLIYKRK